MLRGIVGTATLRMAHMNGPEVTPVGGIEVS